MGVLTEIQQKIDEAREEIAELLLHLGNTYGPVGQEETTARAVHEWYLEHHIDSQLVSIIPGRANTVGRVRGDGTGKSLLFNAHLDTECSGPDFDNLMHATDINRLGAWREGDRLFGHTILNDRGCMALFMIAANAIRELGVPLKGDLILTSVAGETGQAPVDEYQGILYEGKGLGSSYLVRHGVRADYAIVAETTDNAVCWYNCGAIYYKITVSGRNMYTPRLLRGETLAQQPNAIVKAAAVIQAVEDWAVHRQRTLTQQTPCGEVQPKAQVGAIRGGLPFRPNRSSPYAALYVDVRILPGEDPEAVTASLRDAVDAVGVGARVEMFMVKPGAVGVGIEPLVSAIAQSHQRVYGRPLPEQAEPAVVSMWRDTNIFNLAGIPALTFGPSRGRAAVHGTGHFELDHLVAGAKMYALTALAICAGIRED